MCLVILLWMWVIRGRLPCVASILKESMVCLTRFDCSPPCCRPKMGLCHAGHIHLYTVLWHPPQPWCAHLLRALGQPGRVEGRACRGKEMTPRSCLHNVPSEVSLYRVQAPFHTHTSVDSVCSLLDSKWSGGATGVRGPTSRPRCPPATPSPATGLTSSR